MRCGREGATATCVYNALNQRVSATVGGATTEYVFNSAGQRVSEWNATTHAQLKGKYYWGGKPVAYYANGSTHFEHQDWLGTERLRTTYNGGVEGSYNSLPFGDGQAATGADADANHYATLDHDTETATDHAQFRQYSEAQGRWLSPDPYSGSYDASNPQSFNRYAYASNNPLAMVDPSGMDGICDQMNYPDGVATQICPVEELNTGVWDGNGFTPEITAIIQEAIDSVLAVTDSYDTSSIGEATVASTDANGNTTVSSSSTINVNGGTALVVYSGYGILNIAVGSGGSVNPGGGAGGAPSNADPPCKIGPCTYTIYTKPRYPPGNACVGGHNSRGQPATFVSLWDCVGTVPNCKQNQSFYQDACSAAGNTPMECVQMCNIQAGACSYTCQCCHY